MASLSFGNARIVRKRHKCFDTLWFIRIQVNIIIASHHDDIIHFTDSEVAISVKFLGDVLAVERNRVDCPRGVGSHIKTQRLVTCDPQGHIPKVALLNDKRCVGIHWDEIGINLCVACNIV